MKGEKDMNKRSFTNIALVALAAAGMLFAGCAKKSEVATEASGEQKPAAEQQVVEPVRGGEAAGKPSANSVYFAFDKSDLDAASIAVLEEHAAWLNANASASITIEGNCDERGSREYNLALGQRRADSVRDFLVERGVNSNRIDTVSFGEERPVCTGSGEACWAQNRRSDIVAR